MYNKYGYVFAGEPHMAKELKKYNGRAHPHECAVIAAYSKAHAVRLAKQAIGENFSISELNTYWTEGNWGYKADVLLWEPDGPGVWIECQGRFYQYVGRCEQHGFGTDRYKPIPFNLK